MEKNKLEEVDEKEQINLEDKIKKFKLSKKIAIALIVGIATLLQGCGSSLYYPSTYPYRNYDYYPGYYRSYDGCDNFGGHYYRDFGGCW